MVIVEINRCVVISPEFSKITNQKPSIPWIQMTYNLIQQQQKNQNDHINTHLNKYPFRRGRRLPTNIANKIEKTIKKIVF